MTLSTRRSLPVLLAAGITASVSIQTATAQTVVTQWDQFAMAGITAAGPAMDELIGTCEPDLGGATVLRTIAPSIGIRDSYRLAVSANKTPDLAYTWPAASVLAGYARVGALAPLDDYYEQYGWEGINDFYRGRNSFEDAIYGVPMEQDLMGVYYNPALFEENGIAIPTTYAEFQAAADAFKEKGITPIAFGNRDRWPATNTLSLLLGLSAGKAVEEEVLFGDTPWANEQFKLAAETFQSWAESDYFPNGFNGIGYDEANALFLSGRAAMTITGTWVLQDMARGASFDLGVFMLPPVAEGVAPGTMWGEGSQWQVSANASQEVKDAAAAYINCLISPASREVWVEKGFLVPIGTTPEELEQWDALPIVKSFYSQGLATPDANFYDLHTTLPESVTQVLYAELQRLIGGDTTADEFLDSMDSAWQTAIDNGERWVP
ncbi:raffinose/stachyose/melibiose transport system substrate-binding protein [Devosia subaequoris]|uniref:Raffinose/stachyose/melibiose transport system substrate-binding protein n=1 Tax=Devosia subaequoris TaxID=395930 RepID=A0A7W6ND02_9HYPH|nr:extracellular solute-binding protein [Devosia subaequoris]MBB4053667.1 raffinose/stachyose/melibiose transport system substrate-binding protein [Devosia subaequoris]MCP1211199.1 extracellular solute-binding protein [Devosia subaequoris]